MLYPFGKHLRSQRRWNQRYAEGGIFPRPEPRSEWLDRSHRGTSLLTRIGRMASAITMANNIVDHVFAAGNIGAEIGLSQAIGPDQWGAIVGSRTFDDGDALRSRPEVDPELARAAILFCNVIDRPINNIANLRGSETRVRPDLFRSSFVNIDSIPSYKRGDPQRSIDSEAFSILGCFAAHSSKQPDQWSIWRTGAAKPLPKEELTPDAAVGLRLTSALLVPHREVELDVAQAFAEARKDELQRLRNKITEVTQFCRKNEWQPKIVEQAFKELDRELAAYNRLANCSNVRMALASLTTWTNENGEPGMLRKMLQGALPVAGSVMFGSQSLMEVAGTFGLGSISNACFEIGPAIKKARQSSPFQYTVSIQREL